MFFDLPQPISGESAARIEVPPFIREIQGAERCANPFERFNFWDPERLGAEAEDYATGQRHFLTALAFARANQATNFLANIVGGMCNAGSGPMELGFIDILSRKATYGRLPDPISATMAEHVTRLCGHSEEEIRFGETEASEYLKICREYRCPEIIRGLMVEVVNRTMGPGSLTFMWTVCGAAYLGSLD